MEIKNIDLLIMNMAISELINNKTVLPTKFIYALLKNQNLIKGDVEILENFRKPSPELTEFEEKRVALNIRHAVKENGEPVTVVNPQGQSEYKIEDTKAFSKEYAKLSKEYEAVISEAQKKTLEYQELLENKVDFPFHTVSVDKLPEQISADTLAALMPIIAE